MVSIIPRGNGFFLFRGQDCSRQVVNMTSVCFLYLLDVRDFPERQDWVVLCQVSPPDLGVEWSM